MPEPPPTPREQAVEAVRLIIGSSTDLTGNQAAYLADVIIARVWPLAERAALDPGGEGAAR